MGRESSESGERAPTCRHCGVRAPKLYVLSATRQHGPILPGALRHFCYLRLVGLRPTRAGLVGRGAGVSREPDRLSEDGDGTADATGPDGRQTT